MVSFKIYFVAIYYLGKPHSIELRVKIPYILLLGETTSHLTSKWRGTYKSMFLKKMLDKSSIKKKFF